MDTRTEVRIQKALPRLMEGRTIFAIAHRLSTIRYADQVLVINNGEIIEKGTHSELMDRKGFYHHLYYSQFKGRLYKGKDLELPIENIVELICALKVIEVPIFIPSIQEGIA